MTVAWRPAAMEADYDHALLMLIVAPIAATMIQLAVSRSREYQADATGAHFTGNPYALASALQKLDAYSRRLPMQASPSTAHLFIVQPFLGMNFGSLFSTHPPIAKRIRQRLTRKIWRSLLNSSEKKLSGPPLPSFWLGALPEEACKPVFKNRTFSRSEQQVEGVPTSR